MLSKHKEARRRLLDTRPVLPARHSRRPTRAVPLNPVLALQALQSLLLRCKSRSRRRDIRISTANVGRLTSVPTRTTRGGGTLKQKRQCGNARRERVNA